MAINLLTASNDKIPFLSLSSSNSSKGSIVPNRLLKQNFATASSIISSNKTNKITKQTHCKSPYLNSNKVHLLSQVTEKRVVQKKGADFASSLPLAVKIYKANSDEFRYLRQSNKRVKKSVLTLPNKQAPAPQTCTVSDMNDSEDFNHKDDNRKKKAKKRPLEKNRRLRNNFEFYDRNARYCSQLNIHLDRSSTDVIKKINDDGKKHLNRKKQAAIPNGKLEGKLNSHDVWRVLRNLNRFQFRLSPPMSEENFPVSRKKDNQMRFNKKDTRFIGTCRTEEFAYISSIEVNNNSPTSFSHTSSFDRVTVIDKKDDFSRIHEEFEKSISKTQNGKCTKNQKSVHNRSKSLINKSLTSRNKISKIRESDQHTIPTNDSIYVNKGTISKGSSSVFNKNSSTSNAHIDVQQSKNNDNLTKPVHIIHQMQNNIDRSEIKNNFKSPVTCDSSEASFQNSSKAYGEVFKIYQDKKYNHPMNGITKVMLIKDQDAVPTKRLETSRRKPRLATTLTTSLIDTKITQTDVRRKLLNMKYPLIILGKDQVRSTIQVMDYKPPQFEGLDNHIWPFMIEWSGDCKHKAEIRHLSESKDILNIHTKYNDDIIVQKRKSYFNGDYKFNKVCERKVDISACEQTSNKERKWTDTKLPLKKPLLSLSDLNNNTQESKKQKPIRQLKDKMLKLLYKKPLTNNPSVKVPQMTAQYDDQHRKITNVVNKTKILDNKDAGINPNDKINTIGNDFSTRQYSNSSKYTGLIDNNSMKRPWAKAKWASDFIENVIKKMRNGVYYSQDIECENGNSSIVAKEASVQTISISEKPNNRMICDTDVDEPFPQPLIKRNDLLKIIPGFDNSLTELEVQTLDKNKIEIKNCLANIIVQFDIALPQESDKLGIHTKRSCSLIPLDRNDSNTKLFKCKATIVNAMLPAELCAILPDMMRKIIHSNIKSSHSLPINKTDSQLSTISELSHFESLDPFKTIAKLVSISSPEIGHILSGKFSHLFPNRQTSYKIKNIAIPSSEIITLLPKLPENVTIIYVSTPIENILKNMEHTGTPLWLHKSNNYTPQNKVCETLQPCFYQKKSALTTTQSFNLLQLFESMWNAFKMFGYIDLRPSVRICTISLNLLTNENIHTKKFTIKIDNLKLDSLFENYAKIYNDHNTQNTLHGNENLPGNFFKHIPFCETKLQKKVSHSHGRNHKIKRKGFVKLYQKCKSTSNIPSEKNNLPLGKLTNLGDFFLLLGSKSLTCVFDGNTGTKILSSITTMKNWITEINSRQAILVLLLANKKDTSNLIRFRPVLLQGIAVNRITRASELDMEIEVIEREKLNGFSQLDGISYLPASTENKDNLLEELNWIAKTTASDYQKPFDESSEKLLKSLLEKRKQLNPSYLRVMARYVGLGLLKSPTKK